MGTYVGRSVGVYFPSISKIKTERWMGEYKTKSKPGRKQLRKQLNKVPDGFVIRWYNSLTGKFNGYVITSDFATQGHHKESGWGVMARMLAWGSSCANQPCLFIGAAIDDSLQAMYYRKVDVIRTGLRLAMYLFWHCCFTRGNFKNHVMDWERVGVLRDKLDNLRVELVDPSVTPSFETMGKLDIAVSEPLSPENSWSVVDSEGLSAVTGVSRSVHQVKDHNGVLGAWTAWECYKIRDDSKVEFKVGGDSFWVPGGLSCTQLIKHLKDFPSSPCEVFVDPGNNFRWRVAGVACGSKPLSKCRAARYLLVSSSPFAILGGGLDCMGGRMCLYVSVAAGSFFVPQSIREQVFGKLQLQMTDPLCDEAVDLFFKTKLILHAAARFERVRGQTNSEELLAIVDSAGSVVATNIDEVWKRQRR
jgi:hypothetical protein